MTLGQLRIDRHGKAVKTARLRSEPSKGLLSRAIGNQKIVLKTTREINPLRSETPEVAGLTWEIIKPVRHSETTDYKLLQVQSQRNCSCSTI